MIVGKRNAERVRIVLMVAGLVLLSPLATLPWSASAWSNGGESGTGGWTHYWISGPGVPDYWNLTAARSHTGTYSWYSGAEVVTWVNGGDTALETPILDLTGATTSTLTFWQWYVFDATPASGFFPDGGIVEVYDGVGWTQIFPAGGYDNITSIGYTNPIEGLWAFVGDSGGWVQESFDLSAYVGTTIKIRFHVGWDYGTNGVKEGWYIDDVDVSNALLVQHDIAVSNLLAPSRLQLGATADIGATIMNGGYSDETNVVVNLTVDGVVEDTTTIPSIANGSSVPVSFLWTPAFEKTYLVCVEAQFVPNENITTNNKVCMSIDVRSLAGVVLFDQTHGTDNITNHNDWVGALLSKGYIIDTFAGPAVTPASLAGYDVFVIPQAQTSYMVSEVTAVRDFVVAGGGLLVLGDDAPVIYSALTTFAGIDFVFGGASGVTTDITPHDVTSGVLSVYLDSPVSELTVGPSALSLIRDPFGGDALAVSEIPGRVAAFPDTESFWDFSIASNDNLVLAVNLIDWLVGVKYDHDVIVYNLQAPEYMEPGLSTSVNATIRNSGFKDETDVVVNFTVDGVFMSTKTIASLLNGTSTMVSYPWTPAATKVYNVCVEVQPVPNENVTTNNKLCQDVDVRPIAGRILWDESHSGAPAWFFDVWINDLFSRGYLLDTFTTGSITPIVLAGYDVLVVPSSTIAYNAAEITAIQDFVTNGEGLMVIGDVVPSVYNGLTLFADITWTFGGMWGVTTDITAHEITAGVSSVYLGSSNGSLVPGPAATSLIRDSGGYDVLVVSETPGRVAAFVDWSSLQDSVIINNDNLLLADQIIDWLMGPRYWHDITVSGIHSPNYMRPGDNMLINATIRNNGLNDEGNILVNFTVDGALMSQTTITSLKNRTGAVVTFPWTTSVAKDYIICIVVRPVPNENVTTNNAQCKTIHVGNMMFVAIYNHGTTADISYWTGSNMNLYALAQTILDTDPAIRFATSIVTDLSSATLSGFDAIVLPDNAVPDVYLPDVASFFSGRKGIVALDSAVCYMAYSGLLWPASQGSNGMGTYWNYNSWDSDQKILVSHDITEDYIVGNVYGSVSGDAAMFTSMLPPDAIALTASTSIPSYAYVVAREDASGGRAVEMGPFATPSADLFEMIRDAVYWAGSNRPVDHDIAVYNLQMPKYMEPGDSAFVNATVRNYGLNDEANVVVNLKVDGASLDSTNIPLMTKGSSTRVSFPWIPTLTKTYDVCIEVVPVPSENITTNNEVCRQISVRPIKGFILFDEIHWTDPISDFDIMINDLSALGYVIDAVSTGTLNYTILSGYDVLVVPNIQDIPTPTELAAVQQFVANDGGLFVFGQSWSLQLLLTSFAGIFWEQSFYSGTATDITPHDVTTGVSSVNFWSSRVRIVPGANALSLIRDDSGQDRLVVSEVPGRVAAFGDDGAFADWGSIGQADNLRLAENIIEWLMGIDRTPPVISAVAAVPDPQETGGYVEISAKVTDSHVYGVWALVTDPHGGVVGNLTMGYDAGTGKYRVNRTYSQVGTYSFRISARDAAGNWATATGTFATHDTTKPIADAGPDQVSETGATVQFDGSRSTDGGVIQSYVWTFVDGGQQTMNGVGPTYTFTNPGTFVVTLNVTDAAGNWDTDTVNIMVLDRQNPVAEAGPDQTIKAGESIVFSAAGSTDNDQIANYTWALVENGVIVNMYGISPTHAFPTAGSYTVILVVRDAAGNLGTDFMKVTVNSEQGGGGGGQAAPDIIIPIVLGLIIGIVVGFLVGVLLMKRRKAKPEEEAGPEPAQQPAPARESEEQTPSQGGEGAPPPPLS